MVFSFLPELSYSDKQTFNICFLLNSYPLLLQAQPPSELSYQLEVPSVAIASPRSLKGHCCPPLPQELLPKRGNASQRCVITLDVLKSLGGKTVFEGKKDNEMLGKMKPYNISFSRSL